MGARLKYIEADQLADILKEDAKDYFYSAIVSFGDALNSIRARYFSWSIVKLYYSCFYGIRSLLALRGHCLVYLAAPNKRTRRPFFLSAESNQKLKPCEGKRESTTHGAIFKLFQSKMPNHFLLSQPIDHEISVDWVRSQRENVNYKIARFAEPGAQDCMKNLSVGGSIRRTLGDYLDDENKGIFEFDPDHAILAFPLRVLISVAEECLAERFTEDDRRYLQKVLSDNQGPIANLAKRLLGT